MKVAFTVILSLIFYSGFTQTQKSSNSNYNPDQFDISHIKIYHQKDHTNDFHVQYYLDSAKMWSIPYMDGKDIMDVKVKKGVDSINKISGKIYITLNHPHHFITIDELTRKFIPNFDSKKQPIIYAIDEKLLTDVANIVFDINYIKDVTILKGSQIKYFKGTLPKSIVFMIDTQSAPVVLRGVDTIYNLK